MGYTPEQDFTFLETNRRLRAMHPKVIGEVKDKIPEERFVDALIEEARRIAGLALRHRPPYISPQSLDAEAGSLMSYGAALASNYRRAASYVDRSMH